MKALLAAILALFRRKPVDAETAYALYVTAPAWRRFFLRWSLRFAQAEMHRRSAICWRLSRIGASDTTHQALAATCVQFLMYGEEIREADADGFK